MNNYRADIFRIINTAIEAVKPANFIPGNVSLKNDKLQIHDFTRDLNDYKNIYVIGFGKASAAMAEEMERILGKNIAEGIVVTKYGHSRSCSRIKIIEAGHPVPDENGIKAAGEILNLVDKAGEDDLVICLISGGGSALFEKPAKGISLDDIQVLSELLLRTGASIDEINVIRKQISQVKGGRLAKRIYPAECISLILSDVIGDPIEYIASGPTAPDSGTCRDALDILIKYSLDSQAPRSVVDYLKDAPRITGDETQNDKSTFFKKVNNLILANNNMALEAAAAEAAELGYKIRIVTDRLEGEARDEAEAFADLLKETEAAGKAAPVCILMGGETTVTIKGDGKGGRNQEFALAALMAMKEGGFDYTIASCGTDGTDGPTDAAGGIAHPDILKKAEEHNSDPQEYLDNNDSYHFFEKYGGHIKTGPTGTNVMDIIIGLLP